MFIGLHVEAITIFRNKKLENVFAFYKKAQGGAEKPCSIGFWPGLQFENLIKNFLFSKLFCLFLPGKEKIQLK